MPVKTEYILFRMSEKSKKDMTVDHLGKCYTVDAAWFRIIETEHKKEV